MYKKILSVTALSLIAKTALSDDGMPGTVFSPLSTQCDATTDSLGGGSNCDVPTQCFEAPTGSFIMEESVHVDTERRYSGTNYSCNWTKAGYASVTGRFQILNKVCVTGYAHSPSGILEANVRGGVKCTLIGRHDKIPEM
jgi:hypothetical protein